MYRFCLVEKLQVYCYSFGFITAVVPVSPPRVTEHWQYMYIITDSFNLCRLGTEYDEALY